MGVYLSMLAAVLLGNVNENDFSIEPHILYMYQQDFQQLMLVYT